MASDRVVVWYSDGAASAVAAALAIRQYGDRCVVVKCDTTNDEHQDNARFRRDVERWIGRSVLLIRSSKYSGVDEVFERDKYMAGIAGARCTLMLKKKVRYEFQEPGDTHVFGYTADEGARIERFEQNNPDLTCEWILRDENIYKDDCYRIIDEAGIALPAMYKLGYDHNNCIGCVKATSAGYWNRIRRDFPDVFEKRVRQSRDIGVRLTRVRNKRVFLDELPLNYGRGMSDGNIECGPFCEVESGV
jgi:hypothetical protein